MNEYDYSSNFNQQDDDVLVDDHEPLFRRTGGAADEAQLGQRPSSSSYVDFAKPEIAALPRVLMMGPRRAGKTSIQRIIFQKMTPHETLFRLEPTQNVERYLINHTPLCSFTLWDFAGDDYGDDDLHAVFAHGNNATSLIFVLDAQDEPYDHALQSFTHVVTRALQVNPTIAIEIFINKVDGELFLSDEAKFDCRRDILSQVTDELTDAGLSTDAVHITFHLTSIYDHSIFDVMSRVVQRLIVNYATMEDLLNMLVSTCSMEKAFLFDVVSKLYISTDAGPVDMQSVELCSDMIDVVMDVSGIYSVRTDADNHHGNNKDKQPPGGGDSSFVQDDVIDAFDEDSASVIHLSSGLVLYLKEVDTKLALICITRAENFRKRSLINYNIGCLKKALHALANVHVDENEDPSA